MVIVCCFHGDYVYQCAFAGGSEGETWKKVGIGGL